VFLELRRDKEAVKDGKRPENFVSEMSRYVSLYPKLDRNGVGSVPFSGFSAREREAWIVKLRQEDGIVPENEFPCSNRAAKPVGSVTSGSDPHRLLCDKYSEMSQDECRRDGKGPDKLQPVAAKVLSDG